MRLSKKEIGINKVEAVIAKVLKALLLIPFE